MTTIAVQVALPEAELSQLREAAQGAQLITRRELDERPALLDEAEILFTPQMDAGRIARASSLRWVQTYGAGVEWLLTPEVLARRELTITNASGIHAQPIAEHVFGWMLSFARNLHLADRQARQQRWEAAPLTQRLGTLEGKTLGVLGLGAIGLRIAELGAAFRMDVIGYRRRGGEAPSYVRRVYGADALHEVLAASDYVVNALPMTPATHHLLDASAFEAMRAGAFLVNIGRGPTIDTVALVEALTRGKLAGAGLDVTDPEPLPPTHSLWKLENVLITPHYSGAHPGYDAGVTQIFVDNLARYRAGHELRNRVDPSHGY